MYKIMLVDDDHALRATIREILEKEDYQVIEADNGDAALAMTRAAAPDLILLDMVMPGIDGMNAIPLLRKQSPRLRIIIMTAYASVQNAVQALKQGADDYLAKPFKINDFLVLIRKHLQESRFQENEEYDVDLDAVFHGVANIIRRRILFLLHQEKEYRFMELVRKLKIKDHTKVNFHLKVLRNAGFIRQNRDKLYTLTDTGKRTAASLSSMVNDLTR